MSNECMPKLRALADDKRRRMVAHLALGGRSNVTSLQEFMRITQTSVSKHLRILREAGIVLREMEATTAWYQIVPELLHRGENGEAMIEFGCCGFRFLPCDDGGRGEEPSPGTAGAGETRPA